MIFIPPSSLRPMLACTLMLAALHAAAEPASAGDPRGRWITASGNLEVEIAPCGPALCGTVTQVLASRSMRHEGESMQPADARSALGMTILRDFAPDDAGQPPVQWNGEIYNRENGKSYRCRMTLDDSGALLLRAYVGIPLFGQTQRWSRVADAATATK